MQLSSIYKNLPVLLNVKKNGQIFYADKLLNTDKETVVLPDGRELFICVLVALRYSPRKPQEKNVLRKNNNKNYQYYNYALNLYWSEGTKRVRTTKEAYVPKHPLARKKGELKLRDHAVRLIRSSTRHPEELAKAFNISVCTIHKIITGEAYQSVKNFDETKYIGKKTRLTKQQIKDLTLYSHSKTIKQIEEEFNINSYLAKKYKELSKRHQKELKQKRSDEPEMYTPNRWFIQV